MNDPERFIDKVFSLSEGEQLDWKGSAFLKGDGVVADNRLVAETIISVLRGARGLSDDFRSALADAIERGMTRPEKGDVPDDRPSLVVRISGDRVKLNRAIIVRQKWVAAARKVIEEAENGRKGTAVLFEVASEYGIDLDALRKAQKFYRDFLKDYGNPDSSVIRYLYEKLEWDDDQELEEDRFSAARGAYIEIMASQATGIPLTDGLGDI